MHTNTFSSFKKGILLFLLTDAYSGNEYIVRKYKYDWKQFDDFVYDNLSLMDRNGFISVENSEPIGFFSWDPRKLPDYVQIGHNCIINAYKRLGKGKEQLSTGISKIKKLYPGEIRATTGNTSFFIPARRMYESAGFAIKRKIRQNNSVIPELIEYTLKTS